MKREGGRSKKISPQSHWGENGWVLTIIAGVLIVSDFLQLLQGGNELVLMIIAGVLIVIDFPTIIAGVEKGEILRLLMGWKRVRSYDYCWGP
jgi:hypothetical protein